jgi:hypothetical protein
MSCFAKEHFSSAGTSKLITNSSHIEALFNALALPEDEVSE